MCDKTSPLPIFLWSSSLTKMSRLAHEFITQMNLRILVLHSSRVMWALTSLPTLLPLPVTSPCVKMSLVLHIMGRLILGHFTSYNETFFFHPEIWCSFIQYSILISISPTTLNSGMSESLGFTFSKNAEIVSHRFVALQWKRKLEYKEKFYLWGWSGELHFIYLFFN